MSSALTTFSFINFLLGLFVFASFLILYSGFHLPIDISLTFRFILTFALLLFLSLLKIKTKNKSKDKKI